ncbi:MAG: hypothetical protein LBH58_09825 [Tannerellaceae bacterium]|nr:hypothetical protein [Tannerellaceae bacterium]
MNERMDIINEINDCKKEIILSQINNLHPKLRAYRRFICMVDDLNFWGKEYENILAEYGKLIHKENSAEIKAFEKDHPIDYLFDIYYGMQFVKKLYFSSNQKIDSYKEMEREKILVNSIWDLYGRFSPTIDKYIDSTVFCCLRQDKINSINDTICDINLKYKDKEINFSLISKISGDIVVDVIEPLGQLIFKYEKCNQN